MNEAIARIIEFTFKTKWDALLPAISAKYQNVTFVQPTTNEWIAMSILPGSGTQITLGQQRVTRQLGVVMFQIFTPKNIGTRRAKQISDLIAQQFRFMQWWLKANGDVMQTKTGVVIRIGSAGAL